MIILDTNVISETQKPEPNPSVMAWLDSLDLSSTYLTAITVAELFYGVDQLPEGKRKSALSDGVSNLVETTFRGRILPFDATAAYYFGTMVASARKQGHTVTFPDGAIAAIARANNHAAVATRDVSPFKAMRIDIVNPWDTSEIEA